MDLSTKKLDPDYVDGNTKEAVYKIARSYGVTEFRVPDGTEVRQKEDRHRSMYGGPGRDHELDVKRELPNMFVSEDALVIPFEDMVATILSRAEPANLAKALWEASEDVKLNFMGALASHYYSPAVTDKDRRDFIARVGGEVVDGIALGMHRKITELESKVRDERHRYDVWNEVQQWWTGALERVRHYVGEETMRAITKVAGSVPFQGPDPEYEEFRIAGKFWNESQHYWREKIAQLLADEQWLDMDSAPTDGTHVVIQTETGVIAVAFVFTTRDKTASWWTLPEALHVVFKPVCWRPLPKPKAIKPTLDASTGEDIPF